MTPTTNTTADNGTIKTTINRPSDGRVFNLTFNQAKHYGSFETFMPSGGGYAEGGLWFNDSNQRLEDYDGIFSLPIEVANWLRSLGVEVDPACT